MNLIVCYNLIFLGGGGGGYNFLGGGGYNGKDPFLSYHSARSEIEHQLLCKAIQNEQSQYKKLISEIETG